MRLEDDTSGRLGQELDGLVRARVIYLATIRKDGSQSRAAPLWFTVTPEQAILVQSGPASWHTRRIRHGSPVLVWVGKRQGPAFIGKAELSSDSAVLDSIIKDYPKKYLMARLGIHRPTNLNFERGERVAIKITALKALPQGFRSQPGAPVPDASESPSQ